MRIELKALLPEGAKVERDIAYARAGERELLLDLYLPGEAPRPLPVVVWVHGGGPRRWPARECLMPKP